jgi:hypothetical protein
VTHSYQCGQFAAGHAHNPARCAAAVPAVNGAATGNQNVRPDEIPAQPRGVTVSVDNRHPMNPYRMADEAAAELEHYRQLEAAGELEEAAPDPAAELAEQARIAAANPGRPYLVHSGSYALYRTPAGEFHLVYHRTASTDPDTGEVCPVDGAPEVHMRDLPERAAMMISAVMDRESPLPPMLESLIFGGARPNLRGLMAIAKDFGAFDALDEEEAAPDGTT